LVEEEAGSSLIIPFSADNRSLHSSTPSTVATRVHSLQYKVSLHATSNPILCEANQAHHPNFLALKSEPTNATQFPQLASNSNTLNNLQHICHDLTVTPKCYLLIQLRAVDHPPIYPNSISKYFLQWQLMLPTPSLAFPLTSLPLLLWSEPLKPPSMPWLTPCPPTEEVASLAMLVR